MNINIYYGGRGIIEDPTLYVINKLETVLKELRVNVKRFNLYEDKAGIATLPSSIKDADGIILASSIEWFGIGGYMQEFLDACWLYADKDKVNSIYMLPVVMATTYGERDGELALKQAWETIGGNSINGLSAYVENSVEFEMNEAYARIIEKTAEDFYRTINKKITILPSSSKAIKDTTSRSKSIELTPQESEQLSKFVSDDTYVKRQKEDIEELSAMFKVMLGENKEDNSEGQDTIISAFLNHFNYESGFRASYLFQIEGQDNNLAIDIDDNEIKCYYSEKEEGMVVMRGSKKILIQIIEGSLSFQQAFMSGKITAKGNFKTLRMLDQIFRF